MGRAVEKRVSYARDITKLSLLVEAIEIDTDRDPDWRALVCASLRAAIRGLERPIAKREPVQR